MPKASAQAERADLYVVHPSSTSRLERKGDAYRKVQAQFKLLEDQKKALMADLVRLIKREGEPDDRDKLRYETDAHVFIHIEGQSAHVNAKKAVQALVKLGVKASVAQKAMRLATSHTPYEYVLMTERKAEE